MFEKTEAYLAGLAPGDLDEVVVRRPFPPQLASTYSALVGLHDMTS